MKTLKRSMGILMLLMGGFAFSSYNLPSGWFKAGNLPAKYNMGIDEGAGIDDTNAATIQSNEDNIQGFGTLMQQFTPGKNYLGKRIRMSGMLKSQKLSDWAGFWLRIDTKESARGVFFDNMHDGHADRSIKGTTDWKKYMIVLNVPDNASNIAFGVLLAGTGKVWIDNLKFEVVGPDVPLTGMEMNTQPVESRSDHPEPVNLGFED